MNSTQNEPITQITASLWTFGGINGFDYISDIQRFGNLSELALNHYSKLTS
ncbi:hypothetical protein ACFSR7_06795 [Cohnella sp. GCM10020058]|uniref:hypothetical protein n=1 Tax=Cohnella sp. GCM10020058 TaxID=3317330 RepID=UPI00362A1934